MATVTLRYWAAAKEAAGVAEERICAETLAGAIRSAGRGTADAATAGRSGPPGRAHQQAGRLHAVLSRSSFLIDGHPVGLRAPDSVPLADGAVIEVLPPFAGG